MSTETDWVARSEREAAAILAQAHFVRADVPTYEAMVSLLASAYKQGAIDGMKRAQEIIGEQS